MGDQTGKRGVKPKGTILRRTRGGHVKRVQNDGYHWTDEAEAVFLDALAAANNVRGAARIVGFSTRAIYQQRRARPEFRAKWEAALAEGIARLDMALVRAAADSMEGIAPRRSPIPKMTAAEAIATARHLATRPGRPGADTVTKEPRRKTLDEVKPELVRKVEVMIAARGLPEAAAE